MENVQKTWALTIGIIALVVGVIGLFIPGGAGNLLGLFGVNYLQTIVHLLVGVTGIYAGTKGDAMVFNPWLGWLSLIIGVVGFFGILTFLNVNTAVNLLHTAVGAVSLGIYYGASR